MAVGARFAPSPCCTKLRANLGLIGRSQTTHHAHPRGKRGHGVVLTHALHRDTGPCPNATGLSRILRSPERVAHVSGEVVEIRRDFGVCLQRDPQRSKVVTRSAPSKSWAARLAGPARFIRGRSTRLRQRAAPVGQSRAPVVSPTPARASRHDDFAGVFGMNLLSGWELEPHTFWAVTGAIYGFMFVSTAGTVAFCRRLKLL